MNLGPRLRKDQSGLDSIGRLTDGCLITIRPKSVPRWDSFGQGRTGRGDSELTMFPMSGGFEVSHNSRY
jgi:hypothetical protein